MSDVDRSATTFRVRADTSSAERNIDRFQDSLGELNRQLGRLNGQIGSVTNRTERFNTGQRRATREMSRFASTAKSGFGALAAFNTFTAATSGLLSGAFAFAVINAGTNLVKLGAQAESTRVRFLALSETIELGRQRYEAFADFADDRGLEFRGLAEAANQLRVVGFEGAGLDTLIREIGIVAGESTERVQRITRALGQMRAFGRVALEELNQLTEAGIPIVTALSEELQVDEGQIRGLIELGKIDFEDVRASFTALAAEGSAFFAASEAQSETLQASFNRLRNATFLFADVFNERVSPSFRGFIEASADVITFFGTFEGQIIGISTVITALVIPAIGGLFLFFGTFATRVLDPVIGRFRLLNIRMIASAANAGILRRALILLGTAFKAAFTGGALALTAIAFVAVPAIIARFERLKEEARELEEALKSIEAADPGAITAGGTTAELFAIANQEIQNIERELVGINYEGVLLNTRLLNVNAALKAGTGETIILRREQRNLVKDFDDVIERADELERRLISIRVATGQLPPAEQLTPISELQFAATQALAEGIRERVEAATGTLEQTIVFAPEFEERKLVQIISTIRKEIEGVVQLSLEGFNFLPDGETITMLNSLLAVYSARLEELRANSRSAKTPTDELNAILMANANALITLNASIGAGLTDASERFRSEVQINRESIRDLLSLRERLASLEDAEPEFLANLDTVIEDFRRNLPAAQFVSDDLFTALFDPRGRASDQIVLGFENLFTDTERLLRGRVDDLLSTISQVRGAGEGFGLIDIFPDYSTDQFEAQVRAEEEFYVRSTNSAGVGIQRQRDTIQRGLHEIEIIQIAYTETLSDYYGQQRSIIRNGIDGVQSEQDRQLRSFSNYNDHVRSINVNYTEQLTDEQAKQLKAYADFGNEIGIYILDQANMFLELEEITEEEYSQITGIVGNSTEEILTNNERLQRALAAGFQFEVPPQARALANFALTLGESIVSALPTIDNFVSALGTLVDGTTDIGPALINTFSTLASGVSLVEQPLLAGQDALISLTNDYESFLENFVRLSNEQREAIFNAFPTEVSDRLRSIVRDYEEVYSRVGDAFNADAFRLLPTVVQDALEEAFQRFRGAEPVLRSLYSGLVDIIETENITLAERTRRFGRLIANNLTDPVLQYAQTVANIVGILSGAIRVADSSFGVLTQLAGGLGEVLGVGRERTIQFVEGLDRLIQTGQGSLILTERITSTIDSFAISAGINFAQLLSNLNDTDAAFSRVAERGIAINAAFRQASAETGNYADNLGMVSDALNITNVEATDAGFALLGLATAGGNLAGLIAPGVGLVAESVANVVSATADAIAVRRVLSTIPSFILQTDIVTLQGYINELRDYEQAADTAADANRDLRMSAGQITNELLSDGLSAGAEAARDYLAAITALSPLLQSDVFNAFLENRGFAALPGMSVLQTIQLQIDNIDISTEEGMKAAEELRELFNVVLTQETVAFVDTLVDQAVTVARAWISALSGIADTIVHNSNIVIQEQERILESLREMRRENEEDINQQRDREIEALREQLDADLLSLTDFYSALDEENANAIERVNNLKEAEIDKENEIQQIRYEAELNSFNIRKVVASAEIAINTAVAIINALAQLGPIAGGIAAGAIGAAGAVQAGLVLAQRPPLPPEPVGLQTGGVVTSPTNTILGEVGPEAVIPLDRYEYREKSNRNDGMTVILNVGGSIIRQEELGRYFRKIVGREQDIGRVRRFRS